MLRSIVSAAVLFIGVALSSAGLASPAAAQSFSPAPGTYVLSGPITLYTTTAHNCTLTVDISVDAAGAATVLSRSLSGGGWCGLAILPYGTWTIAPGLGSTAILFLGFTIGTNNCYGVVQAPVLSSPSRIRFPQVTLPSPTASCIVAGGSTLYATPSSLTVVP